MRWKRAKKPHCNLHYLGPLYDDSYHNDDVNFISCLQSHELANSRKIDGVRHFYGEHGRSVEEVSGRRRKLYMKSPDFVG